MPPAQLDRRGATPQDENAAPLEGGGGGGKDWLTTSWLAFLGEDSAKRELGFVGRDDSGSKGAGNVN